MGPGAALTAAAKQAEQLRKDGNLYFRKDRFGAAIDAYTEVLKFGLYIFVRLVYHFRLKFQ